MLYKKIVNGDTRHLNYHSIGNLMPETTTSIKSKISEHRKTQTDQSESSAPVMHNTSILF